MSLFKDDKDGVKIASEVKEQSEVLRKLSDEVKMLRKEVEFLSTLARKNEETIIRNDKIVQENNNKIKRLLEILEISDKI
jgi:predicted transcriptional regulator